MWAVACGDVTGVGYSAIRFLVVRGAYGDGQRLVEYRAPPLVERRTMPLFTPDSGMFVLLREGTDGGFYAMRFAGPFPLHGPWTLARYNADWHIAASRTSAELIDTVSLLATPYLTSTPDHRYVVLAVNSLASSEMLVVLDAVTLAVVNRTGRDLPQYPASAPTAAAGSQVLLWGPGGMCPVPLVWLDVVTGLTADSTTMPCDYGLWGALTHRRVYRRGLVPRVELYDITAGTVVATSDTVRPVFQPYALATHGRLILFEAGRAAVLDAEALTLLGRVATGPDPARPRTVWLAVVDSAIGVVIGASAAPSGCVSCIPVPDGIVIFDAERLTVIVDQLVGAPVAIVR